MPLEGDVARVVRLSPRQALDQRRLAGSVVTDERGDLAGVHLHVDALEHLDRAKALADVLQLDERGFHGTPLSSLPLLTACGLWPCALPLRMATGRQTISAGHRRAT